MKFSRLTLLQAAIFPGGLLFLLSPAFCDVSTTLYTGITHTSNLEVQAGNDILLGDEESLTRTGFETGLTLSKQSLDYTGGYVLEADAAFNKDLSANDDISRVSVSASKLSALAPDWLLRNRIGVNWYDNKALPSNSYQGLSLESTLGYLNDIGGGTDISLSLKREQHDQLSDDTYDMTRSHLGLTHYFSHEKEEAYWSLQATLKNNNASDNSRDYNSLRLGVNMNQISWASSKGQLGFNWQQDHYDQPVLLSPMGNIIPTNTIPNVEMMQEMGGTREKKRKDNLYSLSLQLGKPLTQSLALQFSVSLGRYDSNISDNTDDFYSIEAKLAWKL